MINYWTIYLDTVWKDGVATHTASLGDDLAGIGSTESEALAALGRAIAAHVEAGKEVPRSENHSSIFG